MSVCLSFLVGIASGTVASTVVGLLFLLFEFMSSTAVRQVRDVRKATREIVKVNHRVELRNRHRYSMGVIIDRLDRTFGLAGEFTRNKCPPLVHHTDSQKPELAKRSGQPDPKADRWDFFELYIRSGAEDIRRFWHVSKIPLVTRLCKVIRQLGALTELYDQLQIVVGELDAAFDAKDRVELERVDGIVVVKQPASANETANGLWKEYEHLHTAWRNWLRAVDVI